MTLIALWQSKGKRWEARLEQDDSGFTLREFKHGNPCGVSFRPVGFFRTNIPYAQTKEDEKRAALQWAILQVQYGFDVGMARKAI